MTDSQGVGTGRLNACNWLIYMLFFFLQLVASWPENCCLSHNVHLFMCQTMNLEGTMQAYVLYRVMQCFMAILPEK